MDRKSFFRAFIPAGVAAILAKNALSAPITYGQQSINGYRTPDYLTPGDLVAITCPAGSVEFAAMQPCVRTLQKWGLNVVFGKTVGKKWQRFGGTDTERLEDFQEMLDNPNVKAIIFGKGGYGTMRIIDKVSWNKFQEHPKWLVGYSDLTVVHLHVHNNLRIPTIHGDMSNGFLVEDASTTSLLNTLFGRRSEYALRSAPMNRTGEAQGEIIGGNLTLLHSCIGSKSDVSTAGKILFIEDVSEYKYSIDRMLMSLKRSGKLDNLAALLVGQFTAIKQGVEDTFNMGLEEIIWDKVKDYDYPVCFNFPAGHIADNRALKMGVPFHLLVGREWVMLTETHIPVVPSAYTQPNLVNKQ